MTKIITPRRLQGFVELDPENQLKFNEMKRKIEMVFENHCFLPLDTPVLELSEILLAKSGGDVDKEIYRFSKGSTDICMRYDLTVPLARFVAMNLNDLNFPFKRYQIGKVYRGERPQKGRLREFYQCDADIIGNGELSIVNDAECINLYADCFKELNLSTTVEISNRKILNGFIDFLNLKEYSEDIFIALDKIEKIGKDGVSEILLQKNISQEKIDLLAKLCVVKGNIEDVVKTCKNLCNNDEFVCGINELKELDSYLKSMGLCEENYTYNLAIIRGHNYYTGTVFEAYLKNHRDFGAVGGGGRYENLASYYTEAKLPGVGMSIGLSRLFDLLLSNNLLSETKKTNTDVAIIPLGETIKNCLNLCKKMRDNKIKADVFAENKSFKSKLKDANKREIHFVVILGEDEVKNQTFTLKNMISGEQFSLNFSELISKVQKSK